MALARGGLQVGDRLLALDGQPLRGWEDFPGGVRQHLANTDADRVASWP